MTALCIIGGVLLFFVWLFTRKLHIGAGFADDPFLYVRILFLKLRLPPEKAAHTEENPKEQTTEKGRKKKAKKEKEKAALPKKAVGEYITIFTDALKELVHKLKRYLFLEKYIIKADIGTDDAAKTAILYGAASNAAAQLWMLVCSLKRRTRNPKLIYTEIKPDFIAEQTDFYADIELSIRLWQILSLGMTALGVYKKLKSDSEVKK
ncbi:MAG: DUF2953 domain-containing protein [Ruminococcus sp.]|nr:DUF2953 domain-containing protein [Ruminococcus sp.]MDD7669801.1 DUF2953 domain-containing protein [Ruminococcus sp.]MDY2742680.1 DUF2953 domain-containing protein [Eubacteriales bacterium]